MIQYSSISSIEYLFAYVSELADGKNTGPPLSLLYWSRKTWFLDFWLGVFLQHPAIEYIEPQETGLE